MLIYNLKLEPKKIVNDSFKNCIILFITIVILCYASGLKYKYDYNIHDYSSIKEVIDYTSKNKQNVYLYTVPSLQFRYLTYSVYEMPPKESFSNLRVIGGWDMYTQNYYDFKERHNLDGDLLDLLKDNVYLIDGKVVWSGRLYDNYKENIINAIKQHYSINVQCEEVKQFDNLKVYKLSEIK